MGTLYEVLCEITESPLSFCRYSAFAVVLVKALLDNTVEFQSRDSALQVGRQCSTRNQSSTSP